MMHASGCVRSGASVLSASSRTLFASLSSNSTRSATAATFNRTISTANTAQNKQHTIAQQLSRQQWRSVAQRHSLHTTTAALATNTKPAEQQQQQNPNDNNNSVGGMGVEGHRGRRRIDDEGEIRDKNKRTAQYALAIVIFTVGMGYAAVPIYRIFCRVTGYGGTIQAKTQEEYAQSRLTPGTRDVTVTFTADVGAKMHWDFYPTQHQIKLRVGEPALAFFTAKNNLKTPITGVATYNVTPMKAGLYFHKIQCFCFDEQRLRSGEEVDMPVFFYIDPKLESDPRMHDVKDIVLSYTFWPIENDDEDDDTKAAANAETAAAIASSKAIHEAQGHKVGHGNSGEQDAAVMAAMNGKITVTADQTAAAAASSS